METVFGRLFYHLEQAREDQLADFYNNLNSMNPTLKFTMESDRSRLSFLDVVIIKNEDRITTDVFNKITYTKQYLILAIPEVTFLII